MSLHIVVNSVASKGQGSSSVGDLLDLLAALASRRINVIKKKSFKLWCCCAVVCLCIIDDPPTHRRRLAADGVFTDRCVTLKLC